jgi:hypothetical protein
MNVEQRVEDLERQLSRYHAQLETAIEQRDKFVLKAAWGAVKGAIISAVFIGAIVAGRDWFPGLGWLAMLGIALLAAVAALLLSGLVGLYLERIEADDTGKFWRLPRWEAGHS